MVSSLSQLSVGPYPVPLTMLNLSVHWDIPIALVAYYGGFTSGEIVNDFVQFVLAGLVRYDLISLQLRENGL